MTVIHSLSSKKVIYNMRRVQVFKLKLKIFILNIFNL